MSGKTVEWLAVLIFFICFFALTYAESAWLSKKSGLPGGKSFAFSFATNIFTVVVGFTLSFVVFAAMIAFTPDGMGVGPLGFWAAVASGAIALLAVSVLIKRFGIRLFRLDAVASSWAFSIFASLIFLLIVTAAPVIFVYFA